MDNKSEKDRRSKKNASQHTLEIAKIALIALVICQLSGCITITPIKTDGHCINLPFIDICHDNGEENAQTPTIEKN